MTTNDHEWQRVVQRGITKNKEWHVKRVIMSGTTNGNE